MEIWVKRFLTGVIVIILLILFYHCYYKYSYFNTRSVIACPSGNCEAYNVHRHHEDQDQAARILAEVTSRNNTLMEHLRSKYMPTYQPSFEHAKNNHIDVIGQSGIFSSESSDLRSIGNNEYLQDRVSQLLSNYNSRDIHEISPRNTSGVTSYTQDKETLILCLRKKELNSKGENDLHDINTIMFVVIHELSHMMNNKWGHKPDFWILFKFMLENAVECGIYSPVDYSAKPIRYCGLLLTYNPLYDRNL